MTRTVSARSPDGVDVGSLCSSLGFLLRMAQLQVYQAFYGTFSEHDLRPGAFSVISIIGDNPGIRQGVLAQLLMIKPAHMTKLVRSLEERGLVVRRIPDHDRRAVELTLSAAGLDFVARHAEYFADSDALAARNLSRREQSQLVQLLRKLTGLRPQDGDHGEHRTAGAPHQGDHDTRA